MSVPISEVVEVSVSVASGGTSAAGFGVPLVVGSTPVFSGVRSYTSLSSVDDDVSTSSAEYAAFSAIFSQSPRLSSVKMADRAADVQQVQTVTLSADLITGNTITFTIDGTQTAIPFNTSNATTFTDIETALEARSDVDAVTVNAGARTIAITTDTSVIDGGLTITAAVTGGASQATATVVETTPAVNIATVLSTIEQSDNSWYVLILTSRDPVDIQRAAAWCETRRKIFIAQDGATAIYDSGSTTDVAYLLRTLGYNRTALIYHSIDAEALDAGWAGKVLAAADPDVRTTTWGNQTVTGITADPLTTTNSATVRGTSKRANTYETIGSSGRVRPGQMASGRFIDVQVSVDWVTARLEEELFNLIIAVADSGRKIPYTQAGLDLIQASIEAVMARGVTAGHFTDGTVRVTMPVLSSISDADKAARELSGIQVEAELAGAVQTIVSMSVTLTT